MNLLSWAQLLWATVGLIAILLIGTLALGACRRTLLRDLTSLGSRPKARPVRRLDPWAESAARLGLARDDHRPDPPAHME